MVTVDEPNGNLRISLPYSEDMDPWGIGIFDRESVQLHQQILHTQTEVTILRMSGKFYYSRNQSRLFPKFSTTDEGVCYVVD